LKSNFYWELFISKLRKNTPEEDSTSFENCLELDGNRHLFQQFDILLANNQVKGSNYVNFTEYYQHRIQAYISESTPSCILSKNFQLISIEIFNRLFAFVLLPTVNVGQATLENKIMNRSNQKGFICGATDKKHNVGVYSGIIIWLIIRLHSTIRYSG
jgi:hypothetical protein